MSSPFEPSERKVPATSDDEKLTLSTRRWIWENIQKFPGIHFRELERKTSVAHGALEYHLGVLEKAGIIKTEKISSNVRYFPAEVPREEQKTLGVLRQEVARKILVSLLQTPSLGNQDLARLLKKSPSTVTFHVNKLEENGLIRREVELGDVRYRIVEKDLVVKLLVIYRSSFLDRLVDRFVTSWEAETLYGVQVLSPPKPSTENSSSPENLSSSNNNVAAIRFPFLSIFVRFLGRALNKAGRHYGNNRPRMDILRKPIRNFESSFAC